MAAQGGWERLRGAEECCDARLHFSKRVEDSVEHNEEREDCLHGLQGATNDESENCPQGKAERHRLLSSNSVHEIAADDASWEIETVHYSSVANVLNERVI